MSYHCSHTKGGNHMNKVGSKHLSLEQRQIILRMIENGDSLNNIAAMINKDPRAVSRELRNRRELTKRDEYFRKRNDKYSQPCQRCSRFPFVCDGCETKKKLYVLGSFSLPS